jgi:hypothetical protein
MIFISYSWLDSVPVRSLASLLMKQGYRVWIDYQDLNLNRPLAPQLAQAIWEADKFLCFNSCHSRLSCWVQFELFLAQIWNKSIQVIYLPHKYSEVDSCLKLILGDTLTESPPSKYDLTNMLEKTDGDRSVEIFSFSHSDSIISYGGLPIG